jgi:hypothetical protein
VGIKDWPLLLLALAAIVSVAIAPILLVRYLSRRQRRRLEATPGTPEWRQARYQQVLYILRHAQGIRYMGESPTGKYGTIAWFNWGDSHNPIQFSVRVNTDLGPALSWTVDEHQPPGKEAEFEADLRSILGDLYEAAPSES